LPPRRDSDTGGGMKIQYVMVTVSALAALMGCAAPPKQAAPPEFTDDGKQDMSKESVEEEKGLAPAKKMPDEMTAEEKRKTCCPQCEKGLSNDKTGQKPDQIPCADYAATLDVRGFCIDYFRQNQMKASECKGVGASAPSAAPTTSPSATGAATAAPAAGK
jgi:hypothetical protein